MRTASVLTMITLMTLALAGCVSDDTADSDSVDLSIDASLQASGRVAIAPDQDSFLGTIEASHTVPAQDADPVQVGAGHQLPELHAHEVGLELLDHNDLSEGLTMPGSGYSEVHVKGDLAVVTSLLGPRGATLVDVSDPSDMKVLSHIYNLDDNWDARISDDGQFLFMGCQSSQFFDCTGVDVDGAALHGGKACVINYAVSTPASCNGGVAVYNITDPANPHWVRFLPIGWTHNVFTFQHDNGMHYVMNEGLNVAEFNPETHRATVATTAVGGSHDVAIQKHPLTGDWLLYTGSKHMSIWNINDPLRPELIGFVEDNGPFDPLEESGNNTEEEGPSEPIAAGWHEQTPMPCLIDGRHITIGGGENGLGGPEPIGVFDTTDPTSPEYLGSWIIPDHASLGQQGTYRYSVHNIDGNCDGQVAVGHYHAGVWVFDISTVERLSEPVTLGYYLPHERTQSLSWSPITGAPIGAMVTADTPNVWTAQWSADGQTLFIPDMTTGLYALAPTWEYEEVAAGAAEDA